MNWNKKTHNFGDVRNGDRVSTTFEYLGSEDPLKLIFNVSCGCTASDWNISTKTLTATLHVTGSKISTINVCKMENGQQVVLDTLTLIGNGIL